MYRFFVLLSVLIFQSRILGAQNQSETGAYIGWVGTYQGNRLSRGGELAKQTGFKTVRLPLLPSAEKDFGFGKRCHNDVTLTDLVSLSHYRKIISNPFFNTVILTIWGSGRSYLACRDRNVFFQYPLKKYLDHRFYYDQAEMDLLEKEYENLTYWLLKTNRGTSKKFILINWEGDNEIYCGAAWFYAVDEKFRQQCGDLTRIHSRTEALRKFFVLRDRGIKKGRVRACADSLCGPKDARVLSAIEFNSVRFLREKNYPNILDDVISSVPQADFYSYSAYESLNDQKLREDLKELQIRFGDKLMVGEFGFDRALIPDFEEQAREAVAVMGELGIFYKIWWQIFDQPPAAGDKGLSGLYDQQGNITALGRIFKKHPLRPKKASDWTLCDF